MKCFDLWLSDFEFCTRYWSTNLQSTVILLHAHTHHCNGQFPQCEDGNAVSVSCLDLHYSVTGFIESKALKDEKRDKTAPLVLQNLEEDDTNLIGSSTPSLTLYSLPSPPPTHTQHCYQQPHNVIVLATSSLSVNTDH